MSMSIGSSGSWFNTSQLASNLFSKLDTKQQGYIDKSELSSALSGTSSSDDTSSTSDTDALFNQLDSDGDGKITQSELSSGLQTLADALQTQLQQSRAQGAGDMPPPPPPPDDAQSTDEGFTQDQLSSMASDSSTDTKRAELFSKLAANFDAADTNGDGKITRDEAMSYDQANPTSSSSSASASSSCNSSSDTASTSSASDDSLKLMLQLAQLLRAYGATDSSSSVSNTSSSSLSVAA